jgi:hypothetical protein
VILVLVAATIVLAVAAVVAFTRGHVGASVPRRVGVAALQNATGDSAYDMLRSMAADWIAEGPPNA